MVINRDSSSPLYLQIKDLIVRKINDGIYEQDSKIPSEGALREEFNVSRITIRKAIDELNKLGYLKKKQGKGTFVANQRMQRDLMPLNGSYTDFMLKHNKSPKSKVIEIIRTAPDDNVADVLNMNNKEKIYRLVRTMKFATNNIGVEVTLYPESIFKNIHTFVGNKISMRKVLRDNYGIQSDSNKQTINLISSNGKISKLMDIKNGSSVYEVRKTSYQDKKPIFLSIMYYDPNKISFAING